MSGWNGFLVISGSKGAPQGRNRVDQCRRPVRFVTSVRIGGLPVTNT